MLAFQLPTSIQLEKIERDFLPDLTASDPIFSILPIEKVDTATVAWEQEDSYSGLQQIRGLNGQPGRVVKTAFNRYELAPGVYGEYMELSETELTKLRKSGTLGIPIILEERIADLQRQLLMRRLNRIKQIGWTLLSSGVFSVSNAQGSVTATDSFPIQSLTSTFPWSNPWLSTPLLDVKNACLLFRGYSLSYEDCFIYVNKMTMNQVLINTNQADLFGARGRGQGTINNLQDVNRLLRSEGLPAFVVHDACFEDSNPVGASATKTYINPAGGPATFSYVHNYIADSTAIIVAKRTDKKSIGAYCITRNASNPDCRPGWFVKVIDSKDTSKPIPRSIQVHDHQNSAPKLLYPSAIAVINC